MSISVHSLTKIYGTQKAVDSLSFEVQKGEILGFLGPNGAGKSTTMKIATGYLKPSSGSVQICGLDVSKNPIEIKKHIGYLPEHNPLYLDMYIREYLSFIGEIHRINKKKLDYRIEEMIDLCGLAQERHKKIGTLSKGYRQRVGLAQALIHDPEVLILDEPTSGLDPNQIIEIRKVIQKVSQEKTLIFSSHIMQEVKALCSRLVIINRGKIVADSTVEALHLDAPCRHIRVGFVEDIDIQSLHMINEVDEVDQVGKCQYEITSHSTEDIRPKLFHWAVKNHVTLIEITQKETSLEETFQKLTQQ